MSVSGVRASIARGSAGASIRSPSDGGGGAELGGGGAWSGGGGGCPPQAGGAASVAATSNPVLPNQSLERRRAIREIVVGSSADFQAIARHDDEQGRQPFSGRSDPPDHEGRAPRRPAPTAARVRLQP